MKITIGVTQADIDQGAPGEGCLCPIALAVYRALPGPKWDVGGNCLFRIAPDGEHEMVCSLPATAMRFIFGFDNAQHVYPFSFDLDVPGELLAAVTS